MKKKKTSSIIIFITVFVLGILLLLIFPIIKKTMSLNNLKTRVTPEIFSLAKTDLSDSNSIEKIVLLQQSYPYSYCDPEIYECDSANKPTKAELESKYYNRGYIDSEFFLIPERKYRDELKELLSINKFKYVGFRPDCTNTEETNVLFFSTNKDTAINLVIGKKTNEGKQFIDLFLIGSQKNLLNQKCY